MSFFAVLGLCAGSEGLGETVRSWQNDRSLLVKGIGYGLGIAMVSTIATLVVLPFTLFHFQMMTLIGLVTNMVAIPLMVVLIMPFIVLTYLAVLLGVEQIPLSIVAFGVEGLIAIASWGASIESGIVFSHSMTTPVFGCFLFGLLWICLWKHPWRWLGSVSLLAGLLLFIYSPDPDIFIDGNRSLIALRTESGALSFSRRLRSNYTVESWRQHSGNPPIAPAWPQRKHHGRAAVRSSRVHLPPSRTSGRLAQKTRRLKRGLSEHLSGHRFVRGRGLSTR